MLKHPTFDLLGQLGLAGMAKAFADLAASDEAASLDHAEWLALLLDHEMIGLLAPLAEAGLIARW